MAQTDSRIVVLASEEESIQDLCDLLGNVGCTVERTDWATRAIDLLREFRPDVIIIDLDTQGQRMEQVFTLRENDVLIKRIPCLFLTSENQLMPLREKHGGKQSDYIRKPVDPIHVLHRVAAILGIEL